MMKKVLLSVHSLVTGGVLTSLINVANLLADNERDVTVMVTENDVDMSVLSRFRPNIKFLFMEETRHALLDKLPYFWMYNESGYWTTHHSAKKTYRHFVGNNKYDIEIAFYIGRSAKIMSGSTNSLAKKYLWIRTDFKYNTGVWAGFKNKEAAIAGFKKFDKIICVSEDAQRSFEEITGITKNVITIHNMVDRGSLIERASEKIDEQKKGFVFAFVGRIVEEKGVDILLRACKRLNDEGLTDYTCWIIGDGPALKEYQKYAADHALDRIMFLGFRENPYKYIATADLYTFTSLFEGYPNTIADSACLGTPVLTVNCTGVANILQNGRFGMITERTDEAFYEGLHSMMTDQNVWQHYKDALTGCDFDAEKKLIEARLLDLI